MPPYLFVKSLPSKRFFGGNLGSSTIFLSEHGYMSSTTKNRLNRGLDANLYLFLALHGCGPVWIFARELSNRNFPTQSLNECYFSGADFVIGPDNVDLILRDKGSNCRRVF